MTYGTIKVDTVTFTNDGVDKSVTLSGLVQNPTFSGNVTVTGTLSGVTVTGTTANFTSGNFTNISGGTHTITSGVFAAGSAASPSIAFTGDLNTGIYSPGADQVAISTGGSGRLFVDAGGNVGVGTASPFSVNGTNLHVLSTGTARLWLQSTTASTGRQFYVESLGTGGLTVVDGTAGSERLRITSAGLVGIGTSSPSYTLDVAGTNARLKNASGSVELVLSRNSNSAGASISLNTGDTNKWFFGLRGLVDDKFYFYNNVAGNTALTIDESSRLGIGTTSPSERLHVSGGNSRFDGDYVSFGNNGYIRTDATGELRFQSGSSGTTFWNTGLSSEMARFDTSGRLLVGTSSESGNALLTVRGNTGSATGAGVLDLGLGTTRPGSAGTAIGYLRFTSTSNTGSNYHYAAIYAESDGTSSSDTDIPGRLVFSTTADGASSPTERLRITSAGLVGVGTSSPSDTLQINKTGAGGVKVVSTTQSTIYFSNAAGTGGYIIGRSIGSDNAHNLFSYDATNSHYVDYFEGGSGGYRSFYTNGTERLRITSAGLVGIGTSSPSATTKMSIVDSTSAGIYLLRTAQGETVIENTGPLTIRQSSGNGANQNIFFKTGASVGTEVTAMTIDGSQRVGIGTTSPNAKLVVSTNNENFEFSPASTTFNGGVLEYLNRNTNTTRPDLNYYLGSTTGGSHKFWTDGTERARIDSSGRLLVGTSTARSTATLGTNYQALIEKAGDYAGFSIVGNKANNQGSYLVLGKSRGTTAGAVNAVQADDVLGYIGFEGTDGTNLIRAADISVAVDGTPGANDMPGRLVFSTTADGASSPTERMRITNDGQTYFGITGNTGLGTTNRGFLIRNEIAGKTYVQLASTGTTTDTVFYFYNGNGLVGSISMNGSATAYNTSSDYRLKENVAPVPDGITRLQQLKPSRFNFIADPATTVDGFIAHEVQAVVPEAITGEKDAVDNDGNPQYQGIDQSKLVPLLTAALQEAIAKIESLEARLTAAGI